MSALGDVQTTARDAKNPRPGSTVPREVEQVPVDRIRPEAGLGRKRDREGHLELQRSIREFGVLTPITVRPAPDGGDFLLVKGQGRTLACRLLGIASIPAIIVDDTYAESEKVQQFLVENVARLKMRPVDRALLIQRARLGGEETNSIAARFGVSPATVRKLLHQLDGITPGEVDTLRSGAVSLTMHALVSERVHPSERATVLDMVAQSPIRSKDFDALLAAIGWAALQELGPDHANERLVLLSWAVAHIASPSKASLHDRLRALASALPISIERDGTTYGMVAL